MQVQWALQLSCKQISNPVLQLSVSMFPLLHLTRNPYPTMMKKND
jgi:hypothetical protein